MEKRWVLVTILIVLAGIIMMLLWSRSTDPGKTGPDTHIEKTAPQALNIVVPVKMLELHQRAPVLLT